jgi:hypothetical protein
MRGRCTCGGAIAFAHEDLGCLQCGEACCPACAFRPEGRVFCPTCTGRMLARGKGAEPPSFRASPPVHLVAMPRLVTARPAPTPTPARP